MNPPTSLIQIDILIWCIPFALASS